MPTHFASYVANGKISTLREFAELCIKPFLNGIEFSKPLPEKIEIDLYYINHLNKCRNDLEKYENINDKEKEKMYKKYVKDRNKVIKQQEDDMKIKKERYDNMLKLIKDWNCPSKLKFVKKIMINNLKNSIRMDIYKINREILNCNDWYDDLIDITKSRIDSYSDLVAHEQKHVDSTNEYIKLLNEIQL